MSKSNAAIFFSTKKDGSMKRNDGSKDLENIKKFLSEKNLSPHFVSMYQVHSGNVAVVAETSENEIQDVDGLVTNSPELSLCILTADCLPILFHDTEKNIIGAAHAGSKGLRGNIIYNTLETFKKRFDSDPNNIQVTIGPSIEQMCYEVGQEVIDQFAAQFDWFNNSYYSDSTAGKYFLDLRKVALQCLLKEGILEQHITVSPECTKCSVDTYYSYRRGDKTERFLSVIRL